ncbi:hypothetical protein [Oceanobacillus alkalisoli]|uniref:hypothetical protein n=1 Tax=Oceanobacillus alkalisoli TaxID=2925113 RepID=UPI001EE401D5|nr:hypothetical protein [Oceanobacillus alkalisoli]MCG5103086.1 hypothetical protein [Oceanobacillus alkalisoli]
MDAIFEFIFGNMFLVILIISGIIGMLSSNKEQQKKQQQQRPTRPQQGQQQRQSTPRRSAPPSRTEAKPRPQEVVVTAHTEPDGTVTSTTTKSIEEAQEAQMERLQRKYTAADMSITDGNVIGEGDFFNEQQLQTLKQFSEEQKVLKKDIRKSLRNKGLINGIIMAEVLGRPRSLKPYQNVTSERYRK